MNISVVIPTYKRTEILKMTLESLGVQSVQPYEIIVVDDTPDFDLQDEYIDADFLLPSYGSGPAAARNLGASQASGDVILFCGDDTIAHKDFILAHSLRHMNVDHPGAVQGYTLWHPEVVSEFQIFLTDVSGFQVNYRAMQNEDGSWRDGGDGFCITTNFSINRNLFNFLGGFDERFRAAAWEDIDFGFRLAQSGHYTLFAPAAVNFHHHRYTLDDYVKRQKKEGFWRIQLLTNWPEVSHQHIRKENLRAAVGVNLQEEINRAKELDFATGADAQKIRYERWGNALSIASQVGIIEGLRHFWTGEYTLVNYEDESIVHLFFSALNALEKKDYTYAQLCAQWALEKENSPGVLKFAADVYSAVGDRDLHDTYLRRWEAVK